MLSPIIRRKIELRFKQQLKYARQCDALAQHICQITKSEISASTVKRLLGFIRGEFTPRAWTLDIIAAYVGYDDWNALQNELAGNKDSENKRIEFVDCASVIPGQIIEIRFGNVTRIKIESLGKQRFSVLEQVKTDLRVNDHVEIEKVQLDLPILVKVRREGASTSGVIIGGITGVSEISFVPVKNESIKNVKKQKL